jgi:hypothetical protein
MWNFDVESFKTMMYYCKNCMRWLATFCIWSKQLASLKGPDTLLKNVLILTRNRSKSTYGNLYDINGTKRLFNAILTLVYIDETTRRHNHEGFFS